MKEKGGCQFADPALGFAFSFDEVIMTRVSTVGTPRPKPKRPSTRAARVYTSTRYTYLAGRVRDLVAGGGSRLRFRTVKSSQVKIGCLASRVYGASDAHVARARGPRPRGSCSPLAPW